MKVACCFLSLGARKSPVPASLKEAWLSPPGEGLRVSGGGPGQVPAGGGGEASEAGQVTVYLGATAALGASTG